MIKKRVSVTDQTDLNYITFWNALFGLSRRNINREQRKITKLYHERYSRTAY